MLRDRFFWLGILGVLIHAINISDVHGQDWNMNVFAGIIMDERGKESLSGVRILLNGHDLKATGNRGEFVISEPQVPFRLSFSLIGFDDYHITIDSYEPDSLYTFYMVPDRLNIDEVQVSTGYQNVKYGQTVGSFSKVGSQALGERFSPNILERLEGSASGVEFDRSGQGQRPMLTVRGVSTIYANKSPLIILDNFPYDGAIENINPHDIEDITILKDAAASAIWGARAANGVIVLRTKSAAKNDRITVEVNSNMMWKSKPDIYQYRRFVPSADFIDMEERLYELGFYNGSLNNIITYPVVSPVVEALHAHRLGDMTSDDLSHFLTRMRSKDVRDDIDKYIYQVGMLQSNNVNVRGGNRRYSYTYSGGYDKDISSLGVNGDRITFHAKNTLSITDRLSLTGAVDYSNRSSRGGRIDFRSIRHDNVKQLLPYTSLVDEQGAPSTIVKMYRQGFVESAEQGELLDWHYSPLLENELTDRRQTNERFAAAFNTSMDITDGVRIDAGAQLFKEVGHNVENHDEESFFARDLINRFSSVRSDGSLFRAIPLGGINTTEDVGVNGYNVRGQLNLNKVYGDHGIDFIAGTEVRRTVRTQWSNRLYGYNPETGMSNNAIDYNSRHPLYTTGVAAIPTGISNHKSTLHFLSYYSNLTYTYRQQLIGYISMRKDQSNIFGANTNNRGRPFMSFGASWNAHMGPLLQGHDVINVLKVRSSLGYSGNVDQRASALTTIAYSGQDPDSRYSYSTISQHFDPELRWESNRIINLGADLSILNHRIQGSIDWYKRNGTDLIGDAPLDVSTGLRIGTIRKNVAKMEGRGLDIELNTRQLDKGFKWHSSVLFSIHKNRISEYYLTSRQGSRFVGNGMVISPLEGKPLYSLLSYRWGGLDPENGAPRGYDSDGQQTTDYVALTSSATTVDDLVYHGSAVPETFGAIGNRFSYRGFELSVNVLYRMNYYYRAPTITYGTLYANWMGDPDYMLRWKQPGDEERTNVPAMVYPANSLRDAFYGGSEVLVHRADNIRLQYVNVGYHVPLNPRGWGMVKKLYTYLNFSNLGILWQRHNNGYDIESDQGMSAPLHSVFGVRLTL